ncbi:branched-chain amino acid transport system substrate-binding protein [Rhodoligotrophos appendicifer]|uniref:ABC transporter substrate-binding protein n=1 Tax=Rhodoligotrophos appendicifer TaxID=987056 RepID=UPI0011865555|nr:ABC transporter substrate-binding protein [Rhodoligotrophos appendicifer]
MLNTSGLNRRFVLALLVATGISAGSFAASAEETIKIGVPMELSGRFVAYGGPGKRGVEMAAEAFGNTVGGKKVEFIYRDVQSEAQSTVSTVNELVNVEKVDFMIGPVGSPIVAAAIPPWQQGKPVWIVNGSSSTKLEEVVGKEDNFFHTYPYAYHYHTSEAAALKHYLGEGKKVAVIYSDDSYGRTHLPYVKQFYGDIGYEIVAEEMVRANATDMNPALTKIARAKPDILVGLVQTTDAITMAKQVQTRKLDVPYLVGTAYTQLEEWQKAVGDAQEGWMGVTTYLPGVEHAANKDYPKLFPSTTEWVEAFKKKYNAEPDFLDIGHYAATGMLLIALDKAGGDKVKAAEELRKMNVETVNGRGEFKPTGFGTKQQAFTDMIVFQRQGGKNVVLWPLEAANGEIAAVKR